MKEDKDFEIIDTSGFDAIVKKFKKIYPKQEEIHFHAAVSSRLGGDDPLDGISIFRGDGYYHFVTFGFSELYEKESEDMEYSGYGFELTFKLKMSPEQKNRRKKELDIRDKELKNICSIFQELAKYVFETGEIFQPNEYIWTGQKEGIDANKKSKITGFITTLDTAKEIETPNGKVQFVELIGATDNELRAIDNKKIKVEELLKRLKTDITDYNRKSII